MKRRMFGLTLMGLLLFALPVMAATPEENGVYFGIWSLIPPVLAILLAFLTKNVVLSLFAGAISGTFLLNLQGNNLLVALYSSFITFTVKVMESLADSWNAGIILQVLAIGGLIALVGKMGGAKAIAEALSRKAKTARSAQLITWIIGLIVFFDDYANALIAGPIMRPVTDKMKVSREKLSFIVDATAAPIAGIAIISTWVGYEMSLIKDAYDSIAIDVNPFQVFVQTIPYRFYNILMLIFVVATIVLLKEFGPMLKAERRARTTGKVLADSAVPMVTEEATALEPDEHTVLRSANAIIPIGFLILGSFVGFFFNGLNAMDGIMPTEGSWLQRLGEVFGNADASIVIFQAALLAGIIAMIMGVAQKIFTLKTAIDTWVSGLKSLLITGVILLLAWSLSSTIKELGTSHYLVGLLQNNFPAFLLPSTIFVIGAVISFATGTSYGTMGILMPLAVPLGYAIGGGDSQFMVACAGAVLTGAIFGDHCSPISDTTILSSMGAASDHIDHTKTQLPYAVSVGLIAIIFGYIPVGLGVNVWLSMLISIIAMLLIFNIVGRSVEEPISEQSKEVVYE